VTPPVQIEAQTVANAQGVIFPSDFQIEPVESDEPISWALKEALREVGVFARDISSEERVEFLVGRSLYDDMPYKLSPGIGENQVAASRLAYWPALPVLKFYRSVLLKPVLDKNGNPVLDANGKPKMAPQYSTLQNTLGQAWTMYVRDSKGAVKPEGFRAFLEAHAASDRKAAAALDYLNKLRDLTVQIQELGLTKLEFDVSHKFLLARVRPQTVKMEDFSAAIMGPTTQAPAKTASQ
jgi:hypothetical protein